MLLFTTQILEILQQAVIFESLQEVAQVIGEADLWAERVKTAFSMVDHNCGVQMQNPLCLRQSLHFSGVLFYQQEASEQWVTEQRDDNMSDLLFFRSVTGLWGY